MNLYDFVVRLLFTLAVIAQAGLDAYAQIDPSWWQSFIWGGIYMGVAMWVARPLRKAAR